MKVLQTICLSLAAVASYVNGGPTPDSNTVKGFYLPHHDPFWPNVDFKKAYSKGARFVFIRVCKSNKINDDILNYFKGGYDGILTNARFNKLWTDAKQQGLVRGAVHDIHPHSKHNATTQAKTFAEHRGKWTNDGYTLPGSLHATEYMDKKECFGLSATTLVDWISDFVTTYHSATNRYPFIFTTYGWWKNCTGNTDMFKDTAELFLVHYGDNVGSIPGGWAKQTFWQFGKVGAWAALEDEFNGDEAALKNLASTA